jgi:hypothetical protein
MYQQNIMIFDTVYDEMPTVGNFKEFESVRWRWFPRSSASRFEIKCRVGQMQRWTD